MGVEYPDFIDKYTDDVDDVRARFDGDADPGVDKRELGFYQVTTQPVATEVARLWAIDNDVIATCFYMYANGVYLDYHAANNGLERKEAAYANGVVTVTGTVGTVVPSGTRFSTTAYSDTDTPLRFLSNVSATIGSDGTVDIPVTAESAGVAWDVGSTAVNIIEDDVDGVTAVVNNSSMVDGTDIESDDDLRERIDLVVANPQGAGNKANYISWASSRSGVGNNVKIIPLWNGPNTVKVVILSPSDQPVSQTVLDDVQSYLTGPPLLAEPTAALTAAAGGGGTLTGTYEYRVTFYDGQGETEGGPASTPLALTGQAASLTAIPVGPNGTVERMIYRSNDGGITFFFLATLPDNTTTTYTDNGTVTSLELHKVNNTSSFEGIAPVGAIVTVDTPDQLAINILASVEFFNGYSLDGDSGTAATRPLIVAALQNYINLLSPGDDVIYRHVESRFFAVTGVKDVVGLQLNSTSGDIAVLDTQVADTGTFTLS